MSHTEQKTQEELAVTRALSDAAEQIERGTMRKLSEDCPDDCENFNTLSLLYSDDEEIADQQASEAEIFHALMEAYPEFG